MTEKILCVGFHKTGTTSFGTAMQQLGYRWQGWNTENSLLYHAGQVEKLLRLTDEYDCLEDLPWPLLYREVFDRHPDTKFVLTARKNMDVWFDSLARHCDRYPPAASDFRRHLYDLDNPREDPERVRRIHQAHIDDVRTFASDNNIPLLEICFEQGDGWEVLCPFLGKPIPATPFPWSNQDPARSTKESSVRGPRKIGAQIGNLTEKIRNRLSG